MEDDEIMIIVLEVVAAVIVDNDDHNDGIPDLAVTRLPIEKPFKISERNPPPLPPKGKQGWEKKRD